MPWAKLKATAIVRNIPPVATSQPVRASARRRRVTTASATIATAAKPSSQPAWPPRPSLNRRSGPVAPPKVVPPAGTSAAAGDLRAAGLPVEAPEPVVVEDQAQDAVVARARDPRPARRRREHHQQRPGAADDDHCGAAGQQLAHRREPTAGRDPQPRRDDRGHDEQGGAHLRLEAQADAHARQDDPAGAPVLQRAHQAPQGAHAAQRQQRVGVVVARDRDRDRRHRQHEPGHEAGRAPPQAAREVVDERDRGDAHERLRHEDAPRVKAEDPRRKRLDPERERRLVHRHQPARVERVVEEVVPARAHRAHGRAVVVVRPAVAVERPQVQHSCEQQQGPELGEGQRPAARDRALARLVEGLRAAAGASGRGRGGRGGGGEPREPRAQGLGNRRHDGHSVGAPAWSSARRPWELPEPPGSGSSQVRPRPL